MRSKLAVTAALILATVGLAPAPAHAAVDSIYHSQWSGTWGNLLVTCQGGAQHVVPPQTYGPCWDTYSIVNTISGQLVLCYRNGSWVGATVWYPGTGDWNCRTKRQ